MRTLVDDLIEEVDRLNGIIEGLLSLRPPERAAAVWKTDPASARGILDELAERAILLDMEKNGRTFYFPYNCLFSDIKSHFNKEMV